MGTSRRDFIRAATGAITGLSLAGPTARASVAAGMRERKDVSKLDPTSPDIQALTIAVRKMKEGLGPADRRNWAAQASIHGTFTGGYTSCQHGNWFFLPWHRGYIYYFEEIVRELSGNDNFALPYWDWSKDFQLPSQFWGAGNPLDNPPRSDQPGSGRQITQTSTISQRNQDRFVSPTVISAILAQPDFETFAGLQLANPGPDMPGAGELEQTPHNFIHRWVGGDMVTGGSPFDPIFWLHHCNIDRLWTEWVRKHPNSMSVDPGWLATTFRDFCDRKGIPAAIAVSQTLKTTDLGYQYAAPGSPVAASPTGVRCQEADPGPPGCGIPGVGEEGDDELASTLTGQAGARPEFMNGVAVYNLAPTEERSRDINSVREGGIEERNTVVRLRLRGIRIPRDQNVALRVHVNCKLANRDIPLADPSYVRSSTFFYPHGTHGHAVGGAGDGSISFVMSVNPVLERLYGDRPFTKDEPLKVVVIAEPLFPDSERTWRGDYQEVSPEQVSFEVIRPKVRA
jgi:tyrosinase